MLIDGAHEGARHVHQARLVRNPETELAQIFGERRAARGEGNLGQQPEGMEERRIVRGIPKTGFRGLSR